MHMYLLYDWWSTCRQKFVTIALLFIFHMKQLIIVGAVGFGKYVHNLALYCPSYSEKFVTKGFINGVSNASDGFKVNISLQRQSKTMLPNRMRYLSVQLGP